MAVLQRIRSGSVGWCPTIGGGSVSGDAALLLPLEDLLSSFNARLRLPGQTRLPLGVEVDIGHERMTLTAGERTVAVWALEELDVTALSDGFHIKVDGEEVVLNVAESTKFASELSVAKRERTAIIAEKPVEPRPEDMHRRISEVATALVSDSVSPADAFAQWLRLLKEINRRHAQGSMSLDQFYRLNTELLDLIPEPGPAPVEQEST